MRTTAWTQAMAADAPAGVIWFSRATQASSDGFTLVSEIELSRPNLDIIKKLRV
jgi:hypothetical protein